ncbi:MAG TPA: cytochrome ubiquinol oxidase subunit I [Pirellulales bacterium]|jgi:cytochrome d ubiquinol oxidase subunit I|nr:cytochrome ubiquinol oxidase subunit I [Pirellulales bacterium]
MTRLVHVILAAFIQGAFFVMSISAYYIVKGRRLEFAKRSFAVALVFGGISCVSIAISGHEQGRALARNQPTKLAALEGHFTSGPATLASMQKDRHSKIAVTH